MKSIIHNVKTNNWVNKKLKSESDSDSDSDNYIEE